MRSMTGFGAAACTMGGRQLTAEVRSVNAKFLDLSFRLPPRWESLEGPLAKTVRRRVSRGKVVVSLFWSAGGGAGLALTGPLYRACARQLRLARPGLVSQSDVLRAASLAGTTAGASPEGLAETCGHLLERALNQLIQVREAEGREIIAEFASQIDAIGSRVRAIEELMDDVAAETQTRLEAALSRLGQAGLEVLGDRERVSREVAMLLLRSDAREEVVRLQAHLAAFRERMEGPGPHGKMLEFLLQELQRELNTLGGKTTQLEVSRLTLLARASVDQMREQVANVE